METMSEIKWNDRFNLGVDEIDKAHQKLFSIVNKLIAFTENPAKQQHGKWISVTRCAFYLNFT